MKRGFAVKVSHMTTTRARSESGQVFALAAIAMVALCAMAGFSVDVASWYVAHRVHETLATPRTSGLDQLSSGPIGLEGGSAPQFIVR